MDGQDQARDDRKRAAFYIDGFNLYHAINDLGQPHLKWISYRRLAEIVIPQRSQQLESVTWCTAYYPNDERKQWRHEQLVGAQQCHGVDVVRGHFVYEDRDCKKCESKWRHPTEKEGDINVAIHLLRGAFLEKFDHAYIVTADSDQVATLRMFRAQFPELTITAVVPPGRKRSEHLHQWANGGSISLSTGHLERAVMPPVVFKPKVANTRRPNEYAPPADWVHPDQRPR